MNKALYRIRIKGDTDVLYRLFSDACIVRGWGKKVVGSGLKESDFDGFDNCSRRIFNARKSRFLKLRLIESIDRKKGKREKYYKITPLGISYLFQNHPVEESTLKRFFDLLVSNINVDDYDDPIIKEITGKSLDLRRSEILKEILKDEELKQTAIKALKVTLSGITIKDNDGVIIVYFSTKLGRDIFLPLYSFTLKDNSVSMNYDPAGFSSQSLTYPEFHNFTLERMYDYFWFEFIRIGPIEKIEELLHDSGVFREEIIEQFSDELHDVLESSISGSTYDETKLPPKFLRLYR